MKSHVMINNHENVYKIMQITLPSRNTAYMYRTDILFCVLQH